MALCSLRDFFEDSFKLSFLGAVSEFTMFGNLSGAQGFRTLKPGW